MLCTYKSNCDTLLELPAIANDKGIWFNLINPTPEELLTVASQTKIPMDFLRAALDEEERSRTEIEDDCLLVVTNIPVMLGLDTYDTLPLAIIVTPDHIVTVCLENNRVIGDFSNSTAKTFNTAKKTRFLFQILYKTATYYLLYVKQMNRRIDEIERQLRRSMKNRELFQLFELQKGFTFFSASLRANGAVLERLLRIRMNTQLQHIIKVYEEDEDLLEDVIIENKQAIEMVEMYNYVLNGMMETFASIISNNLNMVMKVLASMTILLAIPTMISGFFGMNVIIPVGAEHPYGFWYVVLFSLAVALIGAYGLWKRGML